MNEKTDETEKTAKKKSFFSFRISMPVIALIAGLVAAGALVLCAISLNQLSATGKELTELKSKEDSAASLADSRLRTEKEAREGAEMENEVLRAELEAAKTALTEAEEDLKELQKNGGESEELTGLRERISALEALIAAYESKKNEPPLPLRTVAPITAQLDALLASGAPMQKEQYEKTDVYGNPAVGEREVYPKVAFLLFDLDRAVQYSRGEDLVFEAAGVRSLAYALALIDAAEAEEALPEDMRGERKYDLGGIYTFSSSDVIPGTGILKIAEEGQRFTYRELLVDSLQYADVTAAAVLEKHFGTEVLTSYLTSVGTSVMKGDPDKTCTSDVLLLLRAVHEAVMENGTGGYGALLRDTLTASASTVLHSLCHTETEIKETLTFYGRSEDAYHDFGIVTGEHPYIVIFLSDVKEKADTFTDYIKKVEQTGLALEKALRP